VCPCPSVLRLEKAADQRSVDPGIKLQIAIDARALDFGRIYCGTTLTHHGR